MGWLGDRVWQLGISIVLALVGSALIYLGAADDGSADGVALAGFVLFAIALAIPLISKAARAAQEALDEDV